MSVWGSLSNCDSISLISFQGMVTMFNVLIVNDWHAISEVFTYASWHSEPYIVYPFFVLGNLISVSIMLNCVTAFFVGAFVAKLEEEDTEESSEIRVVRQKAKQFTIDASSRSLRRINSSGLSASSRSTSSESACSSFCSTFFHININKLKIYPGLFC